MRFFLLVFCFLTLPAAAIAQAPDPESDPLSLIRPPKALVPEFQIDESQPLGPQVSKAYFDECMKQEHHAYSEDELKLYCGCKAEKLPDELTDEEMRNVFEDNIAGNSARDKIAVFITPPCTREPTANMAYRRCVMNETVNKEIKKYKQFCFCLSGHLGDFVEKVATSASDMQIRRKKMEGDVTTHIIDNFGYTEQYGHYSRKCMNQL